MFELDDIEQDWTWKKNTADFIFSRDLIASIRDFPRLIDQAYEYVPPAITLPRETFAPSCSNPNLRLHS